ncbi:MAG: lysylphosphatidylglycerol synthase transmembrane domain-containing protein [Chloroflexota bacterium]
MTGKRLRGVVWQVLRVAIVAVILYFVLRDVDFPALWASLRAIRPGFLIAAAVVWIFAVGIASFRWKVLIGAITTGPPVSATFVYNLIGQFYSQFLPGNITGDVVKGYYMARTQANKAALLSSAVIDRIIGLVVNSTIGFVALGFSPLLLELFGLPVWVVWVVVVLVVAGVIAGMVFVGWLGRFEDRFPAPVRRLYRIAADYAEHPGIVAAASGISVGYFLAWALSIYLLSLAARVDVVNYAIAVLLLAAVNLVTVLPISINGLGVREGTVVFLLGQFGVQSERALVLSLLILAMGLLVGVVGGLFVATDYRHIREEVEALPVSEQ